MKLTKEHREILADMGYPEKDFAQIEKALSARYTRYQHEAETIGRGKAIELLGTRKFLAGISRSAFHYTAVQPLEDGTVVYFDSSRLFK